MKKLVNILKEAEKDLEDWSANLETLPVERAAQAGAAKKVPTNVQSVWGGPSLDDDDLVEDNQMPEVTSQSLSQKYNLTPDDMQRVKNGDFSTVMSKVGDPGSFAEDVHDVFGSLAAEKIQNFIPNLKANAPMKLGPIYNNLANQAVRPPSVNTKDIPIAHDPTRFSNAAVHAPTKQMQDPQGTKKIRK